MTSTRLPGKVLKTLDYDTGATVLDEVIRRVRLSRGTDEVIVATTVNESDDPIVEMAEKAGAKTFRGSERDVLERYYLAASAYGLDRVIRVTSDCPFIDPEVMDELIAFYDNGNYDYASNTIRRTYPVGTDCEIFSFDTLKSVHANAQDKPSREHVTYYMYTHPESYRIAGIELPDGEDHSGIRITVDTGPDYALACVIKTMISKTSVSFREIVELFERRPYLKFINESVLQKREYADIADEMEDAVRLLRLQEMSDTADMVERELMGRRDDGRE
jgi:spore coat polysaccharide biosynthesis protein SpsF